jgi:uncharacterized membrane protein (DUF485 family)
MLASSSLHLLVTYGNFVFEIFASIFSCPIFATYILEVSVSFGAVISAGKKPLSWIVTGLRYETSCQENYLQK